MRESNSMYAKVFSILFLTLILLTGCGPKSVTPPTVIPPVVNPPGAPFLTVTPSSPNMTWTTDPVFTIPYKGSASLLFATEANCKVSLNGANVTSPINFSNMTRDTTLVFASVKTDPITGLSSNATTRRWDIKVLRERQTLLLLNNSISQSQTWKLVGYTRQMYPLETNPVVPLNPSYEQIVFYPGDTCHFFNSTANPSQYDKYPFSLKDDDNTYTIANVNIYHIIQLDNTSFKIERDVKAANDTTVKFHVVRKYDRL